MSNLVEKWFDKLGDRVAEEGARVRAVIAAGLAETRNGLRVTAARPAPIRPNALAAHSPGRLVGWSVRESSQAGGPAVVTVYDGRDSAADPLAVIPLAAGAGETRWLGPGGVSFGDGAYVEVTGTVVGALYFGAVD